MISVGHCSFEAVGYVLGAWGGIRLLWACGDAMCCAILEEGLVVFEDL